MTAIARREKKKRLNRSRAGNVVMDILLLTVAIFMALPMVYAICNSLKPLNELWVYPPRFFVVNPTLDNFSDLFRLMSGTSVPFSRYLFNTLFITGVGTAGHVIISSLCAYALSKHEFPGKALMFNMVVLSLMFSAAVTGIPSFIIQARLRLIDNMLVYILPAFSSSLGLYLMKQFMEQMVPDSVLEAARIDGAGEGKIYWSIVMPMVKPVWMTLILFSVQSLWNTGASITIQSEELKTLNYALSQIMAGGISRAGAGAAAAVVMMLVPITVFIITQSNVIETMSTSGMKE